MATRITTRIRIRIKVCGITRPEDAQHAAALGVDAIGLVFYAPSPRAVTVQQASAVVAALPPFVTVVGLFVNATPDELRNVLDQVPIDVLQFHGDESPEDCEGCNRPFIKAIRMRDGVDLQAEAKRFASASGLLLDAYQPGVPGGTGESFEWSRAPQGLGKPIILAGGLTPANVGEAISVVQPYAVDVSGGVEVQKGIKDWGKMADFVTMVRAAG
jgi:phosphoribosylanthranilate isomerase